MNIEEHHQAFLYLFNNYTPKTQNVIPTIENNDDPQKENLSSSAINMSDGFLITNNNRRDTFKLEINVEEENNLEEKIEDIDKNEAKPNLQIKQVKEILKRESAPIKMITKKLLPTTPPKKSVQTLEKLSPPKKVLPPRVSKSITDDTGQSVTAVYRPKKQNINENGNKPLNKSTNQFDNINNNTNLNNSPIQKTNDNNTSPPTNNNTSSNNPITNSPNPKQVEIKKKIILSPNQNQKHESMINLSPRKEDRDLDPLENQSSPLNRSSNPVPKNLVSRQRSSTTNMLNDIKSSPVQQEIPIKEISSPNSPYNTVKIPPRRPPPKNPSVLDNKASTLRIFNTSEAPRKSTVEELLKDDSSSEMSPIMERSSNNPVPSFALKNNPPNKAPPLPIVSKPSVENEEEKTILKRKYAANEIITTERTYYIQLKIIVEEYKKPLKEKQVEEVDKLFGNVDTLVMIHHKLLTDMQKLHKKWDPLKSDTSVAKILLNYCPSFKLYIDYINAYDLSPQILAKYRKIPEICNLIVKAKGGNYSGFSGLENLLAVPFQRIPRYELLLSALLKYTPQDHPDYKNVVEAHDELKKIANYVNKRKMEVDINQRFLQISKNIVGGLDVLKSNSEISFLGIHEQHNFSEEVKLTKNFNCDFCQQFLFSGKKCLKCEAFVHTECVKDVMHQKCGEKIKKLSLLKHGRNMLDEAIVKHKIKKKSSEKNTPKPDKILFIFNDCLLVSEFESKSDSLNALHNEKTHYRLYDLANWYNFENQTFVKVKELESDSITVLNPNNQNLHEFVFKNAEDKMRIMHTMKNCKKEFKKFITRMNENARKSTLHKPETFDIIGSISKEQFRLSSTHQQYSACAILDWDPQVNLFENSFSFKENETIIILEKTNESWYYAQKGDQVGYIPSSYVEIIE
eukprot:TRINITY_DN13696_c0_g1_i1.p1 TRINITY_DN13696_c0_g1~~TRINITY_DN13696_c0_g1_i1.p1  ORF type:complete len:1020 (+),score=323.89 TRINITY_DN13696_c0_g1_i1:336-3062(+)